MGKVENRVEINGTQAESVPNIDFQKNKDKSMHSNIPKSGSKISLIEKLKMERSKVSFCFIYSKF